MADVVIVGVLKTSMGIGGEGTGYSLDHVSIPVALAIESALPAAEMQVRLVGHFEERQWPLRPPMMIFIATRIVPSTLDIVLTPNPPQAIVLTGILKRIAPRISYTSGPSYRLDDVTTEIDIPLSARSLAGSTVAAVGQFELRDFSVERHNVQVFAATAVQAIEKPNIFGLDATKKVTAVEATKTADEVAKQLADERDYVAVGTHHSGFIDSTTDTIIGSSGSVYVQKVSFVAPATNKLVKLGSITPQAAASVVELVEQSGFRHMKPEADPNAFMSYHLRLKRGDYVHEVDWTFESPQVRILMDLFLAVNARAKALTAVAGGGGESPDAI